MVGWFNGNSGHSHTPGAEFAVPWCRSAASALSHTHLTAHCTGPRCSLAPPPPPADETLSEQLAERGYVLLAACHESDLASGCPAYFLAIKCAP